MKKTLSILAICLVLITSCTGVKTLSTGLENESFLEFIGNPTSYLGGVNVVLDDKSSFVAEVGNDQSSRVKGKVYAIPTGKHIISVSYKNKLIVKKQIFGSAQETKKIVLP